MDREHVKGVADKAKGAIKEGAGKVTGDKSLEAEGKKNSATASPPQVAHLTFQLRQVLERLTTERTKPRG
jgi:hypothetical protein